MVSISFGTIIAPQAGACGTSLVTAQISYAGSPGSGGLVYSKGRIEPLHTPSLWFSECRLPRMMSRFCPLLDGTNMHSPNIHTLMHLIVR